MSKIIDELGLYGNNYIPEFSVGDPMFYYTISGDCTRYIAEIRSRENIEESIYPKVIILEKRLNEVIPVNLEKAPFFLSAMINWIEGHLEKIDVRWLPIDEKMTTR